MRGWLCQICEFDSTIDGIIERLPITPDHEPSAEVVEKSGEVIMKWFVDLIDKQPESVLDEWKIGGCVLDLERRLASVLTAEVTRRVEERTSELREALVEFANEGAWDTNRKFWCKPSDPVKVARQALANKGGS